MCLTWPVLGTQPPHVSSVSAPKAPDQLLLGVLLPRAFILLINHLGVYFWFVLFFLVAPARTLEPPVVSFYAAAPARCPAVGLVGWLQRRKRSGDFCCALLEAARRGTRDHRKKKKKEEEEKKERKKRTCGGA